MTNLPLVSREWRNWVQLELLLLPFFHSLQTKGRQREPDDINRDLEEQTIVFIVRAEAWQSI